MSQDHSKISVTAKLVAFYRKFSDIPYARDVADFIGADDALSIIEGTGLKPDDLKEFAPIFEARYKSIAALIRKTEIDQVLELASGFSLRGFAMTSAGSLQYVESDLPDLTAEKLNLLATLPKTESQARHYQAVSANALSLNELREAVKHFDKTKRLIVVHEGLLQYFSANEKTLLARNIQQLLADFAGGVWITPDFSFRDDIGNVSEQRKKLREVVAGVTARSLYESAFENEEELLGFVSDAGFSLTKYLQWELESNISSLKTCELAEAVRVRLTKQLTIWLLDLTDEN